MGTRTAIRKPVKVLIIVAAVAAGMAALWWTGQPDQAGARGGAGAAFSFLPVPRWGFGTDDSVQEARALRARRVGGPGMRLHDRRRRLGFIEVRERRWVPLVPR